MQKKNRYVLSQTTASRIVFILSGIEAKVLYYPVTDLVFQMSHIQQNHWYIVIILAMHRAHFFNFTEMSECVSDLLV